MKKLSRFDVLIVYTEALATSASDAPIDNNQTPFALSRNASYNTVYGYFLETCHKFHLKAAFTTSADIVGAGSCRSFWTYNQKKWLKVNSPCFSRLIFDKFSPIKKVIKSRRQLLFSAVDVKPFNDPELFNLFFDKQNTYEKLPEHAIPTIPLEDNTLPSIKHALKTLTILMRHHPGSTDFTRDIIMKDRFGAGGRHIYKFNPGQSENMLAVMRKNPRVSYIIQPFAQFNLGFNYLNCPAATDIRLIYLKGKIVQSYIRMAKSGDFRCNEHQGGFLTYVSLKDIPPAVVAKSNLIAKILNKKCSLYTLDFIISNNGNAYLLEGNTGPGLDWNMSLKKNEIEAKKLIRLIVKELVVRAKIQSENPLELLKFDPISIPTRLRYPALI